MKKTVLLILICLAQTAAADDAGENVFLYGYLSGTYLVVGKELDGRGTYFGKVVFESKEDHLVVRREIKGKVVKGIGKIEPALGPDRVDVLRVRFSYKGREFEITYLWQNDLDNYPRLSGYLYRPGIHTESPGLEALFIDPKGK